MSLSFFNILINDYLTKKYPASNRASGLACGLVKDEIVDDCNKWIPDNNIVLQYNKYLNNCAELRRLDYVLEYVLIPKSKRLVKDFMKKSRSSDSNDRSQVSDIRNQMSVTEKQILTTEDSIIQLENMDLSIVEKWKRYLEKANCFLQSNNIDSEITINDILSDDALYILCKKFLNNCVLDPEPNKYLKIIEDVKQFFDIGCQTKNDISNNNIQYEKKLDELRGYETENSLDVIIQAPKLFLRDADNNPISYELNINNEPVELTDDLIMILCEEYNPDLTN